MGEIIDQEEIDKDTSDLDTIERQFNQKYKLLTETAVSLKQSYINKIAGTKSLKLAVSQSDNSIEVYELNNTSLSQICRLSGHQKALSEVVFSPKEDHFVYSCGEDGLVKLWDTRANGSCVQEYKGQATAEEEILRRFVCMDVSRNGKVLCAGSLLVEDEAYMVFWDKRKPTPLGGYWNSHTDDISQVKFHPTKSEVLASGSLDNLINIYNILEPSEVDALTYSLNIENSVEKLTWLDDDKLACITQSNDFQLWNANSADLVKSYTRDKVARSIKRSKPDDCYLVDAFTSVDDSITILAGSYGGNGDVLRSVTISDRKLQPCTNFTENKQIVRCCLYDQDRDLLFTAGESGLISVWNRGDSDLGMGVASKISHKLNKLHVNRHKPY